MTFRIIVRPEAEADLCEAYRWYESRLAGLGIDYLAEIGRALEAIREIPERYPRIHKNVRKALVRRFPYAIFFFEEGGKVVVISIHHQSRDPERWKHRT